MREPVPCACCKADAFTRRCSDPERWWATAKHNFHCVADDGGLDHTSLFGTRDEAIDAWNKFQAIIATGLKAMETKP